MLARLRFRISCQESCGRTSIERRWWNTKGYGVNIALLDGVFWDLCGAAIDLSESGDTGEEIWQIFQCKNSRHCNPRETETTRRNRIMLSCFIHTGWLALSCMINGGTKWQRPFPTRHFIYEKWRMFSLQEELHWSVHSQIQHRGLLIKAQGRVNILAAAVTLFSLKTAWLCIYIYILKKKWFSVNPEGERSKNEFELISCWMLKMHQGQLDNFVKPLFTSLCPAFNISFTSAAIVKRPYLLVKCCVLAI